MRRFQWAALACLAIAWTSVHGAGGAKESAPATSGSECDRACLNGMVDRYIDALLAHDPARVPTTPNVRFIENGVELPIGSALWRTATARGTYSHYFADVAAGQVGFIGTLREHGTGLILVLRLAVDGRQIREIEQLAIRTGKVDEYEKLTPDALWNQPVADSARLSRDTLMALANRYYTGMQRNDPKGDYSFFHKDCNRVEHGRQTTNMPPSNYGHSDIPNFVTMGCEAQFQTGFLGFVTTIRERRFPVVDEERQTVLAFGFFDHDGSIRSIPLSTGQTFKVPPYFSTPRTLMIAEAFKITDSKLRLIEAALTESPYGMKSVLDQAPRAAPRRAARQQCDMHCTQALIDGVLSAMIRHDPTQAALAPDVRYTENGQPLAVGDGLWRTLTARGAYNLYLAGSDGTDPALFGSIVETDIPGQISLRVRQREGKITEIEALVVRQEIPMLGALIGTGTLMAPPQLANFDAEQFRSPAPVLTASIPAQALTPGAQLRHVGDAYVQAAYGMGRVAPFADHCTMRENGVASADNPSIAPLAQSNPPFHPFRLSCRQQIQSGFFPGVGKLRQHRILAVDASQGLVLITVSIDHPGDTATVKLDQGGTVAMPDAFRPPNSYLRAVLLKVRAGRIEHVEAITRPVFYGLDSGWKD